MPKSKNQSIRFQIIDRELRKWPISSKRLVQIISDHLGTNVTQRTIQKDIDDMKLDPKLGYFAPIEYDAHKKQYYYQDKEYSITKFNLKEVEIKALKFYADCLSVYSSYSIFSDYTAAINKIVNGVNIRSKIQHGDSPGLIIQTDTSADAKGQEFFPLIVDAIIEAKYLEFTYQKFNDSVINDRCLAPCLLKEYKGRWYIFGVLKGKNDITTFAIDRISQLSVSPTSFEKKVNFNSKTYFQNSFGITLLEGEPEKIILHFSTHEAPYIRSLPIHPSQEIIDDNTDGLTISICIVPSYEFYQFILGKTPHVKVITPERVKEKVLEELYSGLKNYSK
jgi:predicted DNA-binding transcriptional regulator YafY